jgi:hypothetical protein
MFGAMQHVCQQRTGRRPRGVPAQCMHGTNGPGAGHARATLSHRDRSSSDV